LKSVVEKCQHPDIIRVSGDFFQSVPTGVDGLILSRVLHDWDDPDALQILSNCRNAMGSNSTLYIIENCDPDVGIDLSLLSLNMAVMCRSKERSKDEYIRLCVSSGFEFDRAVKLNQLQSVLLFSVS
jgi:C-methyltransferase